MFSINTLINYLCICINIQITSVYLLAKINGIKGFLFYFYAQVIIMIPHWFALNRLFSILWLNLFHYIYCRIEKLGLHARAGKIKTMGAVLCLAGALTISLYKGKAVISHHNQHPIIKETQVHRTRGTLFLVGSILSYGLWFICQVMHNMYSPL